MSQEYTGISFIIFNISEINIIDFSQVLETSAETIRKSVDGTKTFIKYDDTQVPTFIKSLITKEGPYTYSQFLTILSTSEWNGPNPLLPIVR